MQFVVATLILLIIFLGVKYRHNLKLHIPLMSTAFVMDIGLLLWVEFNRHAINKATHELAHPAHWLLLFHVAVSLVVLVCYILLIISGIKLLRGNPATRNFHRSLAYVFILCRLANYITSFWVAG